MAMFHHDKRDYKVAVSEAAKKFHERLEERFHKSVPRVEAVMKQIENDVPGDMIVTGNKLRFETKDNALVLVPPTAGMEPLTLHAHALGQVAQRTDVRNFGAFVTDMNGREAWGKELIAHNLNEIYAHSTGRYLVREVRKEVRGFLSDKFRRLDSNAMLEAFIGAMDKFGARPIDGFALQTKVRVRCFLPMVFEPFPGELLAIGAELGDSDYGDGFLTLKMIQERMVCTNLATLEDTLKQVHLGKRLPDNIQLSQRTLELDSKTMASAINDMASNVLGPAAVNTVLELVRTANEQKVTAHEIGAWVKKNLNKEEGQKAREMFASAEAEIIPAGQNKWRWSNTLSWLARETGDERRKLELQEAAGEVMQPKKETKKAEVIEPEYV
jgi:hypothetical protein